MNRFHSVAAPAAYAHIWSYGIMVLLHVNTDGYSTVPL